MNPYNEITKARKKPLTAAQESLKKGYLELCRKKTMGMIGVTELCKRSHVARTTFYMNYPNVDTLLEEIEDALIADLLNVNERGGKPERIADLELSYLKKVMSFSDENRDAIYTLLIVRPDIRLIEKWKMAVKYHFWEMVYNEVGQKHCGLVLELISGMSVDFYKWVLEHPDDFDGKIINRAIQSVIASL